MIVSYPSNTEESNAIKAVLKALKVKFDIRKDELTDDISSNKNEVLENIKAGLQEVKEFKTGKLKTTTVKDFLNEL